MQFQLTVASVAVLGMAFSFLLCVLLFLDRRFQMRLWRDTLVYMKAKTSYEAEDAIERSVGRDKGIIQKVLAQKKKEAQNLKQVASEDEDLLALKKEAEAAYDTDTLA